MAATPVCTGPVASWIGVGLSSPSFYGYGEVAPQSVIQPRWAKVMSDRTGGMVPRDKMYQSEEAFVFIKFAEWNDIVRETVASTPLAQYGRAGSHNFGDIGTLVVTEGFSLTLYLVYPFSFAVAGHPVFNASSGANKLVNGYRFFGVTLEQQTNVGGTQPNSTLNHFHSIPVLQANGSLICYDHNVTAVQTLTP